MTTEDNDGPRPDRDFELAALWRDRLAPLGFLQRSLWLIPRGIADVDAGPSIAIDGIPEQPLVPDVERLAEMLVSLGGHLGGEEMRWAMALSRPGGGGVCANDRSWARALTVATERVGVMTEPFYVATDVGVFSVPQRPLRRLA